MKERASQGHRVEVRVAIADDFGDVSNHWRVWSGRFPLTTAMGFAQRFSRELTEDVLREVRRKLESHKDTSSSPESSKDTSSRP